MAARYTEEMFWAKVDRSGDGCWNWLGRKTSRGYGQIRWHGVDVTAHRLAAYLCGKVESPRAPTDESSDQFILHQCDNSSCCNPAHMNTGTKRQNLMEAIDRGLMRYNYGATHHNTKLSDDDVRDIIRRWPTESQGKLAKEYGVTQACISLITRRINRATVSI